jgi:hypothetical protein
MSSTRLWSGQRVMSRPAFSGGSRATVKISAIGSGVNLPGATGAWFVGEDRFDGFWQLGTSLTTLDVKSEAPSCHPVGQEVLPRPRLDWPWA